MAGIFLCYIVFFYKEGYSEGFPTSGNDRIAEIFTPVQSIEEFFDQNKLCPLVLPVGRKIWILYGNLYILILNLGGIMKTTLNIPDDLIKEAMLASKSRTKTEAVITGLRELVRQRKIARVLSSAGKLEFSDKWEQARHGR